MRSFQTAVCHNQWRDIINLLHKGNMVHLNLLFPRNDIKLYNLFGLAKKEIWKAVFYLFDHNRYLHLLFQQHLHLRNASIAKLLTLWPLLLFSTINPRTCSRFGVFLFLINLIFSGKWTVVFLTAANHNVRNAHAVLMKRSYSVVGFRLTGWLNIVVFLPNVSVVI